MYKKILVPLDGSEFSEQALPYAESMAKNFGAELVLMRVAEISYREISPEFRDNYEDIRQAAVGQVKRYLEAHIAALAEEGISASLHYEDTTAVAEALIDAVPLLDVDLIVMCTHGRSGIGRWLIGSVTEKVLRHAGVPILIIRPTENSE